MMVLATDMGDMQRDLADSQKLLDRIQHVMDGQRAGSASSRTWRRSGRSRPRSMNQLVGTRQQFAGRIRQIIDPIAEPRGEARSWTSIAIERDGIERQLSEPADHRRGRAGARAHDEGALRRDRPPGVRAERRDPGDGGAAGRDRELLPGLARPSRRSAPRTSASRCATCARRSRSCAACTTSCARRSPTPRRDATAAGGIGEAERETTKKLSETLQRELAIEKRAMVAPDRQRSRAGRTHDRICSAAATPSSSSSTRSTSASTRRSNARLETVNQLPGGRERRARPRLGQAGRHHGGSRRAWAAASPRRCSPRSPTSSTTWSSAPTSASSTSPGASRTRRPRRSPSLTNQKNLELQGARRGLPQGAGGGQVTRVPRALLPGRWPWSAALARCRRTRGAAAAPAAAAPARRCRVRPIRACSTRWRRTSSTSPRW